MNFSLKLKHQKKRKIEKKINQLKNSSIEKKEKKRQKLNY